MQIYQNRSGDSGVTHFEIGADYIDLRFRGGRAYRYDHLRPGMLHVNRMKELAESGDGLATYLNQHVRKNFARELA
jgi:hypothetical protein